MSMVQQTSTSAGISAIAALRASSKRQGRIAIRCTVTPAFGQAFDRVVGAAGVGDDAIIGIDRRVCPALGMRGLVQRDGVDRDFQGALSSRATAEPYVP